MKIGLGALSAVAGGGQATANVNARLKAADAEEANVDAKASQLRAEKAQDQLEEENKIIQQLMESKNRTVDAVLKMMNATFGTTQKIMAAGMAK